jgi:excisionase family DNA binding protein
MGAAERHDEVEEIWKAEDVAESMKLGRTDVYQMVHSGEIPAWLIFRLGRRLRFDAVRFRRWFAEKRASSLPKSER